MYIYMWAVMDHMCPVYHNIHMWAHLPFVQGLPQSNLPKGANDANSYWGKGINIVYLYITTLIPSTQLSGRAILLLYYYFNPHSLVIMHDSSQHQAHKNRDRCGHHKCQHSDPRGECLYEHWGYFRWDSSRNYHVSMVIYAYPIHVCTPSSVHGSLQCLTG